MPIKIQNKPEGKDQDRYNQVPHLTIKPLNSCYFKCSDIFIIFVLTGTTFSTQKNGDELRERPKKDVFLLGEMQC